MRAPAAATLFACLAWAAACSSSGGRAPSGTTPDDGGGGDAESADTGGGGVGDAGPGGGGLGPAQFGPGELDAPSDGGTITFQQIGATGWYPSRRDPATGPCDQENTSTCCRTKLDVATDALTPWETELVMTLRGPINVKQLAVYVPATDRAGSDWNLVSSWDGKSGGGAAATVFDGDATPNTPFSGAIGSECIVNAASSTPFGCGPGSDPYCPPTATTRNLGWIGSKLFVILAAMPHSAAAPAATACSKTTTGNWYDAPWIGLSVGELVRAGAFSSCQCYAKDPTKGYLADGCGQFNVFEVVNDNNSYKNLDVFSTDMIDYAGYVGQGPCGPKCAVASLGPQVDLIDKTNDQEAAAGAVASPAGGPSAAFRRPETGYRYFLVALDVASRTVQLGMVHPRAIPASIGGLLPNLPGSVTQATISAVLALRLPH